MNAKTQTTTDPRHVRCTCCNQDIPVRNGRLDRHDYLIMARGELQQWCPNSEQPIARA